MGPSRDERLLNRWDGSEKVPNIFELEGLIREYDKGSSCWGL